MKTLFIKILIFLVVPVLAFDIISFWLLPTGYGFQFSQYRRDPQPKVAGRYRYPKDYFVKHPQRGFDIGTNRQTYHWVEGVTYPIWSNSIGCFDREYTRYDPYVYFAGDSLTWGYTPFEEKFGTLIEKMTGVRILKCGVTHTGQRHQHQKFIEIVQQIGHLPQALFVFYHWNDVANDHVHPHSTVIDGWQVNNISIDKDYRLTRHTDQELAQKIVLNLKRHAEEKPVTWRRRILNVLMRYSLTVNLINSLAKQVAKIGQPDAAPSTTPVLRNIHTHLCRAKVSNRDIYALMCLAPSEEGFWFSDNPIARENKSALLDFRDFAQRNDLLLVVALMPVGPGDDPRGGDGLNTEHYREVRDFLDDKGIRFVDLTLRFRARGLTASDLYWKEDPHLNPAGNRAVAEILIEEFPQLFSK
ncbi:hypothetical protein [Candidatus Thiosymbion oneisti]|uniref:hypothetical protein n=1 Tax=Candidatus Thiosymbion oneisti TaxID=589554 RepID=UPI000B7DFAD6|nr:hypothetical protein [Candidatus Thiosymbion oneisti]